jgi:copper(I)-binding protein
MNMRGSAAPAMLAAVLALGGCSWFRHSAAPAVAPSSTVSAAPGAPARIDVTNAWIRPATPGQEMVPAYCDVRAATASTLVAVESPVAEAVEIREPASASAGERVLTALPLPRGANVRLAPGGNYLALIGVRRSFANGESVPLWLTFRDERGGQYIVRVEAQVRGLLLRPKPTG